MLDYILPSEGNISEYVGECTSFGDVPAHLQYSYSSHFFKRHDHGELLFEISYEVSAQETLITLS
jgi:hypothetical protein